MPDPTPDVSSEPVRIPAERYFALAREGAFGEGDRVELLEGVIVCVPPMSPRHGWAITAASAALQPLVGGRASLRVQCPLVLGTFSVPEPDLAVVPGTASDWGDRHPTTALLVVVRRDPEAAQGRYRALRSYEISQEVEPVFAPGRAIPVRELLPEPGGAPTA